MRCGVGEGERAERPVQAPPKHAYLLNSGKHDAGVVLQLPTHELESYAAVAHLMVCVMPMGRVG